ncbi:MAG: MFS transporter [Verrucomicrobia bacterium]|nr:MFS transporter [Verrucomicrobiota bacterium]MDA1006388.1 MFS transporter [Verrucomicrobiota bacterium]
MTSILRNAWALLLGMLLLMIGNGMHGTLLGIRGALEGFSPSTMSYVMAGYFLGFLGGSHLAPKMIRRVGHVRVFAALGSLASAAFILFPAFAEPILWTIMRVLIGFCFSGIYVVAESWLNDAATNETRGKALSAYVMVQMIGIVSAQLLLNFADVGGYLLFVTMSVLVSLSFLPILLSVSPAPVVHTAKSMRLGDLYKVSPLGTVGMFLLGAILAMLFGMMPVYGTAKGLNVTEISILVGLMYLGALMLQYPIGWISDRMDRRRLIIYITVLGAIGMLIGFPFLDQAHAFYVLSFFAGGLASPLYSLTIAYTNDYLEPEDMAAASGALIFLNGVGAVGAPIVAGLLMARFGPDSFFLLLACVFALIAGYAIYRTTRRVSTPVSETSHYVNVLPQASHIALGVAQDIANDEAILAGNAAEDS